MSVPGQQFYFYTYTAVGDIIVIAVCIVMLILVSTSYVIKSQNYSMFINMIIFLVLSAFSDIIMHNKYTKITDGNYTPVYVLRIAYHLFLFSLFLLFILYILNTLNVEPEKSPIIMYLSTGLYLTVMTADVISTVRGNGFNIAKDGTVSSGFNVFLWGYTAFMIIITAVMIIYRGNIYRKTLSAFFGTICVSVLILYIQSIYDQASFTVATFLFPVLSIMYLLHSNPYDVRLGAINIAAFQDAVRYSYSQKNDFIFISLYLPDYDADGKTLPKELQDSIRRNSAEFFKNSVLFQANNGHVILLADAKSNPHNDSIMDRFMENFKKEYDSFRLDYKMVIGSSIEEISKKNEYLSFIRSIHRGMQINTVHIVEPGDVTEFNKAEYILKQLDDIYRKRDLDDSRVLAYCQPIYNIKTGKYDTAEALMRLQLDNTGTVFPDLFIPLAEEHGYIHVLTEIILHKTCEAIRNLIDEGFYVKRISVNVSVLELRDQSFSGDVDSIISDSGIPKGKIAIEITESQSDSDFLAIKTMIDELKGSGIKFYLDDFGTGYSNMERIMKLPFDIIKFDRSLVLATDSDSRSEEIVGRLAGMFADLDYSVLYEGVENETDEERCRHMSASYLQGYKYSRPVPIQELKNFFSRAEAA